MLLTQVILEIFGAAEYTCARTVVAGPFSSVSISFVVEPVVMSFEEMGSLCAFFERADVWAYVSEHVLSIRH
jgi:hypothetical protein